MLGCTAIPASMGCFTRSNSRQRLYLVKVPRQPSSPPIRIAIAAAAVRVSTHSFS